MSNKHKMCDGGSDNRPILQHDGRQWAAHHGTTAVTAPTRVGYLQVGRAGCGHEAQEGDAR